MSTQFEHLISILAIVYVVINTTDAVHRWIFLERRRKETLTANTKSAAMAKIADKMINDNLARTAKAAEEAAKAQKTVANAVRPV